MKWQNVKHWPDNVGRVNTSCSCIYLCLFAELQTPPKKALAVDKEFWFLLTAKWTKKGVRHRLAKKALFTVGLLIFFFLLYCSVKIDVLLKKQTWQVPFSISCYELCVCILHFLEFVSFNEAIIQQRNGVTFLQTIWNLFPPANDVKSHWSTKMSKNINGLVTITYFILTRPKCEI